MGGQRFRGGGGRNHKQGLVRFRYAMMLTFLTTGVYNIARIKKALKFSRRKR